MGISNHLRKAGRVAALIGTRAISSEVALLGLSGSLITISPLGNMAASVIGSGLVTWFIWTGLGPLMLRSARAGVTI